MNNRLIKSKSALLYILKRVHELLKILNSWCKRKNKHSAFVKKKMLEILVKIR